MDATFILGRAKRETLGAHILARADRRGEAVVGTVRLHLRSAHNYVGTALTSATPVGYILESGDLTVGAIELTDVNPTIFLPRDQSPEIREAVLLTTLALAVLRDPAESALQD